ncbi:tail fiber assembly protein [Providencia sp. PROV209]|uniref:tail fiber assembly protein n=1 Tax=Providencia sp. PROV209 TaxID=2949906 RepID=UPI00234AADF7|nr:tail fiber assembly protein [Providencia sp. PROV209]EIL1982739.1 tail fiber assembly protein [Providencia rettgeri]
METIKLYHYDNFTGEFQNTTEPYEGSEIPPFSTEKKPLKDKLGYACVFKDNKWVYIEDHRGGEYYSTLNASLFVINELGALPENVTAIKPNRWDDVWDGNQWIPKPPLSKEELIADAEQKKQLLADEAEKNITILERKVRLGMATDDEKDLLIAWEIYSVKNADADTSKAPDIDWGIKPE